MVQCCRVISSCPADPKIPCFCLTPEDEPRPYRRPLPELYHRLEAARQYMAKYQGSDGRPGLSVGMTVNELAHVKWTEELKIPAEVVKRVQGQQGWLWETWVQGMHAEVLERAIDARLILGALHGQFALRGWGRTYYDYNPLVQRDGALAHPDTRCQPIADRRQQAGRFLGLGNITAEDTRRFPGLRPCMTVELQSAIGTFMEDLLYEHRPLSVLGLGQFLIQSSRPQEITQIRQSIALGYQSLGVQLTQEQIVIVPYRRPPFADNYYHKWPDPNARPLVHARQQGTCAPPLEHGYLIMFQPKVVAPPGPLQS
jgi:hypothetical protein